MPMKEGEKMIEQLYVKDYILFDKAFIDFDKGMTSITGETGAGKSLLIDAIGYLMGKRIPNNIVKKGKEKCVLQMVLSRPHQSVCDLLEENGFDIEDHLIIQRTITNTQKSTIRINQQVSTLHFVKEILSMLIDVHSQQDTFYLMDSGVQMDLLDQYANTVTLRKQVKQAFLEYEQLLNEYLDLKENQLSEETLDVLTDQYNEIEEIWIPQEEYDDLLARIENQSKSQKTLEDLSQAAYYLDQDNGILDQIYNVYKSIDSCDEMKEESQYLQDTYYQLQDVAEKIKNQREILYQDSLNLDSMQEKVFAIKKALRKYGGSFEAMNDKKNELMTQIESIIHRDDLLDKLQKKLNEKKRHYDEIANELSMNRKAVLSKLSQSLESHFHDLMLEHARFQVRFETKDPSINGVDLISYEVSMNPGQPFLPLKQAASGGELSRLMLALKVVFHSQKATETLIFDEIDTGVSGKVAFKMGEKMKMLSGQYQVLCITHLASVAAWADSHFKVSKQVVENSTQTTVSLLNREETIEELAMMSSGKLSEASKLAALELKQRVKESS